MRKSLFALIAAATLAVTSTGHAQGGRPPAELTHVNLEFQGGSMDEFINALRGASNGPVNVVLQGQANKIHVDSMKLRDVTVASAVRAALEPRIGVTEIGRDGTASTIMLTTVHPDDQGQPVFIVGLRTDPAATGRPSGGPMTDVLSIQRLVQGSEGAPPIPEQVVLSAIDSGLKLAHAEGDTQPEISYHKDSGLLLIRGNPADLQVVRNVVSQMSEDHKRRGIEATQKKKMAIHHQAEMQKIEVKMGLADRRAQVAQQRVGEIEQMVQAGHASRGELRDALMVVEEAKAQVQLLKIEMAQLAQEAELGGPDTEPGEAPKAPEPSEKPKAPAGGKRTTR